MKQVVYRICSYLQLESEVWVLDFNEGKLLVGVAHTFQPPTRKGGEICLLLSSWSGSLWRELGAGTETAPVSSTDTCVHRSGSLSRMWLLALVLTSLGSFTAWGESS